MTQKTNRTISADRPMLLDTDPDIGASCRTMKHGKNHLPPRAQERVELGRHIVADPAICHGKPTFKGTRIMVWQVLDELAHGADARRDCPRLGK